MKRIKQATLIGLMLLLALLLLGCKADGCYKIPQEEWTKNAAAAIAAFDGERGIMLYADPNTLAGRRIRMYAVLYGPTGRELVLSRSLTTLNMNVSGAAEGEPALWRIEYDPTYVRRAEFKRDGKTLTMDGYAELPFVFEQALLDNGN